MGYRLLLKKLIFKVFVSKTAGLITAPQFSHLNSPATRLILLLQNGQVLVFRRKYIESLHGKFVRKHNYPRAHRR